MKRVYFSGAAVLLAGFAGAQSFSDDFNRADGGIGANYNLISGPAINVLSNQAAGSASGLGLTLVDAGVFTGNYDTTAVSADVSLSDATTTLAYCALALGSDGTATASHGILIKLQRQSPGVGFNNIGFYTGAGSNTTAITGPGGSNFFALPSVVTACHMTVMCTTLTNLYVGLDTDFNGSDDISYNATLNFPTLVVGNRVGMHIYGTTGRIDNFRAGAPVPEPGTIAVFGLAGAGLLLRRKRK